LSTKSIAKNVYMSQFTSQTDEKPVNIFHGTEATNDIRQE